MEKGFHEAIDIGNMPRMEELIAVLSAQLEEYNRGFYLVGFVSRPVIVGR